MGLNSIKFKTFKANDLFLVDGQITDIDSININRSGKLQGYIYLANSSSGGNHFEISSSIVAAQDPNTILSDVSCQLASEGYQILCGFTVGQPNISTGNYFSDINKTGINVGFTICASDVYINILESIAGINITNQYEYLIFYFNSNSNTPNYNNIGTVSNPYKLGIVFGSDIVKDNSSLQSVNLVNQTYHDIETHVITKSEDIERENKNLVISSQTDLNLDNIGG